MWTEEVRVRWSERMLISSSKIITEGDELRLTFQRGQKLRYRNRCSIQWRKQAIQVDLGILVTWQWTSWAISLKELQQINSIIGPTAYQMRCCLDSNLLSSEMRRKAQQVQSHNCRVHLVRSEAASAGNTLDYHQTCDKTPKNCKRRLSRRRKLTPSRRNTVESLQFALCFVKELHKWVMKRDRTALSVLHVVRATQTSPSDDIATMMLIF